MAKQIGLTLEQILAAHKAKGKQAPPKVKVQNPWGKEPYFEPYSEGTCFGPNN